MPLAAGNDSTARFADAPDAADDAFLERLRGVCATVTTDEDERTAASRDWWPLAMFWARAGQVPARPTVVVRPTSTEEVAAVLRTADEAKVPVTPMAGRSGVCGASVPVFGGVALDLTDFGGIIGVDDESLLLDVRPGTWGDTLEDDLRAEHGVTLGHWPQSMALSTVGGWVACRSAGQYSTRYGKIEDMVVGLEVALADGSVIRTGGAAPRSAVGPDLTQLFVGSEGTLGVITEAQLRVHPLPPAERKGAWSFASFEEGLDVCRRILRRGATPAVLRLYDHRESKRSFDLEGRHALIVLDEGDGTLVDAVFRVVEEECVGGERHDDALVDRWLHHRNDVSGLADAITRDVVVDTLRGRRPMVGPPGAVSGRRRRHQGRARLLGRLGPPVPRLHRRCLPVLHLRRPAGRRRAVLRRRVGSGHPCDPRRRRRHQPSPRHRPPSRTIPRGGARHGVRPSPR